MGEQTLDEFLMEAFTRMTPKNLCYGFRNRKINNKTSNYLIEKQVQADFYKAISSMLPSTVSIFCEASQTIPSHNLKEMESNKIDFYID